MKNVLKIDDKNFKIVDDINNKETLVVSTKKATPTMQGKIPAVQIVDIYERDGQTVIPLPLQVNGVVFNDAIAACVELNSFIGSFKKATSGDGGGGVSPDYSSQITELMQFKNNIQSRKIKNPENLEDFSKVFYNEEDGLLYVLNNTFSITKIDAYMCHSSSSGNIIIAAKGGVPFQTSPTLQPFRYTIIEEETNTQIYQGFSPTYSGFSTAANKKYRIIVEDANDTQTVLVNMLDLTKAIIVTAENNGVFSAGSKIKLQGIVIGDPSKTEYIWTTPDGDEYSNYGMQIFEKNNATIYDGGRYYLTVTIPPCAMPITGYIDISVK